MSRRTALIGTALLAALPLRVTPATAADATAPAPVSARWQKHELKFDYHGFTSYYTCDGLEAKVREILLHFGARKGARVSATGCPGANAPSAMAWVTVEFESLGEAGKNGGPDAVAASWQPVELRPRRPSSMGDGECEIVEQLKPVLTAGFALQGLDYRTHCVPHQVSLGDYSVSGKVLMPGPAR
jgi:hypothetical protein